MDNGKNLQTCDVSVHVMSEPEVDVESVEDTDDSAAMLEGCDVTPDTASDEGECGV